MKAVLQLYIEGTRVDLFKDESVNVVQSIQNVRDISKIFVEFTRTFNIPASKTNNKIFEHYYNYSISDGFDGRLKKSAIIELNHRPYKTGKIKLDGVDLKDGKPNQYRITFFGNTIDLNDLLGDDNLSSLELSDFDKTYDAATVELLLKGSPSNTEVTYSHPDRTTDINYPRGVIAPLISHTTRLYYQDADSTDYPDASGGNLYPKGTSHQGVYWEELKYAIPIDAIIRAIEDKYGLTFSNDFFNTTNDKYFDLFLWLHRKKGKAFEEQAVTKRITNFLINYNQLIPEVTSYGDRIVVQNATGLIDFSVTLVADSNFSGKVFIKENGDTRDDLSVTVTNSTTASINGYLTNGTYEVFVESSDSSITFNTSSQWDLDPLYYPDSAAEYPMQSGGFTFNNTRTFAVSEQIPDIKVIDFLTGIFKMFNLTAYTDNGVIVVKTLDEYYDGDTVWDITDYVDVTDASVDAALPYKEVDLKYEGLGTKLAKQHEQLSNTGWGTESYRGDDYYDANPETYEIILPFEHMKFERLQDAGTNISAQVGWFVDDNNDPYYGSPLLFYAYRQTSATTIRFLTGETSGYNDITEYYIPLNSVDIDPAESEFAINFKREINEYTQLANFDKTLFTEYYQTYISDVFQLDKRLTTIHAYLPIKMMQEFILSDIIAISDRNYRINEIETDFTTGRSRLELLNQDTVSIGGSAPIDTTTTDPDVSEECTADSTLGTVDSLTPTADTTCDVGRSLVITGPTSAQQTNDITLTATANNFIGTASYLWAGGEAAGETTASVTITNANTGNVTYTCTATDSDDSAEFVDTHIVLWTPKKYRITLNIVNNITGDQAGYNISGNQDGDYLDLEQGQTYSFNTTVTPNNGYEFTTGPTVSNAQGIVGTSNQTVNTTLSGAVQTTTDYIEIFGPDQQTINNNARLSTVASGFTPTSYQWARSTDGGSSFTDISGATATYVDVNESTAATYTYRVTASDGTVTAQDVHNVIFTEETLVSITLSIDTSNITASGFSPASLGYTLGGDPDGLVKTQNSGTVFNFQTTISLNSGFEWVSGAPTVNNAGGTFTSDQTVTTTFSAATIQLIVYNYYVVTGCAGESVAGQTVYVRTRDTFTVGSSSTGTYITISNECYYTSATAFETDWATNNGITVGDGEGTGCDACTDVTTTDPCLATKTPFYLRYSSTNDVCENTQNKGYYYVNGAGLTQNQTNFCNITNLYTYADCTVAAPAGHYSLDIDNTVRRYWNGSSFSVCINCIDANGLYYLGTGWNVLNQYCDDAQGVFGYYYFDNNRTLTTATSNDHMYTSASNVGTPARAPEGFYTDLVNYRYYEPSSLQVWENVGSCPPKPTTDPCDAIPSKPTLTVFRQYVDCATGLDQTITVGNNSTAGFPAVIKDVSTGECYKNPTTGTGNQDTDWVLQQSCVGGQPAYDYEGFDNCDDCTGTTTTTTTTTTTSRPDNVFVVERQSDTFVTYVQLDAAYNVGDIDITISTDGSNCYDIIGTGAVSTPTDYGTITGSCTTTTTTTTTTTVTCGSQLLYKSAISAEDVCCNVTVTKIVYMDSNDISTATAIYSNDTCSSTLGATQFFTADFSTYYQWNHLTQTLTSTTCPACP